MQNFAFSNFNYLKVLFTIVVLFYMLLQTSPLLLIYFFPFSLVSSLTPWIMQRSSPSNTGVVSKVNECKDGN